MHFIRRWIPSYGDCFGGLWTSMLNYLLKLNNTVLLNSAVNITRHKSHNRFNSSHYVTHIFILLCANMLVNVLFLHTLYSYYTHLNYLLATERGQLLSGDNTNHQCQSHIPVKIKHYDQFMQSWYETRSFLNVKCQIKPTVLNRKSMPWKLKTASGSI